MLKQKWLYCFLASFILFLIYKYLISISYFKGFSDIGALIILTIAEFALIGAGLADLVISILPKKSKDVENSQLTQK